MKIDFLELRKEVKKVNELLSVIEFDKNTGFGAVLYDCETTLEFCLCEDMTLIMCGGDTIRYGEFEDLDLDSKLLGKVFDLFEKVINDIFKIK